MSPNLPFVFVMFEGMLIIEQEVRYERRRPHGQWSRICLP
jgi:hypothetical protein